MKILFFSPVPTDPPNAGNRARILTLTTALQRAGHEVHFAYLPLEEADLGAMEARFGKGRLHVLTHEAQAPSVGQKASDFIRKLKRAAKIDSGFMYGLDDWYRDDYSTQLKSLNTQQHFDAMFVEYVFMSKAFEAMPASCLRILDTHDSFGLRHRAFLKAGMKARWYSTSLAEEERGFQRADAVLAIQDEEAGIFRKRLGPSRTQVLQVGHLIDIGAPASRNPKPSAVFVGSDNPINAAGANFFIAKVLPLILAKHPEFKLSLAGTVSKVVPDAPGIVKLGFVEHLKDAFGAGAIAVNPILMGTGVNIKLLDALAFAMPCVSTESGARGLDPYRDSALVVVRDDDVQGFADAVLRLLDDRAAQDQLGQAARQAAEAWNAQQLQSLQSLLTHKRSVPAETSKAASPVRPQPVGSF